MLYTYFPKLDIEINIAFNMNNEWNFDFWENLNEFLWEIRFKILIVYDHIIETRSGTVETFFCFTDEIYNEVMMFKKCFEKRAGEWFGVEDKNSHKVKGKK